MKHTILVTKGESPLAFDKRAMDADGWTDEDRAQAFPEGWEWCEVEFHPATHGRMQEAKRAAMVDDGQGVRLDDTLLPSARAATLVKSWPSEWGQVSGESFDNLHPSVAGLLDTLLLSHLFPSALQHEGFMNALKLKQQDSEAKPKKLPA